MKDLVDGSGVHRQTVHSYLREGLLPGPCSGAGTRNARYSQDHVELLHLIRELRDDRGMSLDAIRRIFERCSHDPEQIRQAKDRGPAASPLIRLDEQARLTERSLAEQAGASIALVRELVAASVIAPEADDPAGRFEQGVVQIVETAQQLVAHGLADDQVVRVAQTAQRVASLEAQALVADATGATDGREPLVARAEERHRRVSALLSTVRLQAVRTVLRRLAEVAPRTQSFAMDAIYVPSPLFIKRHRLDRVLADAEEAATAEDAGFEALEGLGRLLLGLGRYAEAELWLGRAAERPEARPETFAYLGLAQATAGRIAQGVESCRRALELAPGSPRATAFLGAALALHAASTTGLGNATEVLRLALHEASRSRRLTETDIRERMEVLIARGRLFTVLPRQLTGHDEGLRDLEEVLERTRDSRDEDNGFDFPGTNELYRIHALYYLGVAASDDGRIQQATAWLRECVTLDPASHFAERAYDILSRLR